MLIVHHLQTSRSQRILWLLEELGVPYELKIYARNPQTRLAPAELKAVHPLGKSPVISDDGEVVAESAAIIEYLVETYGLRVYRLTGNGCVRFRKVDLDAWVATRAVETPSDHKRIMARRPGRPRVRPRMPETTGAMPVMG